MELGVYAVCLIFGCLTEAWDTLPACPVQEPHAKHQVLESCSQGKEGISRMPISGPQMLPEGCSPLLQSWDRTEMGTVDGGFVTPYSMATEGDTPLTKGSVLQRYHRTQVSVS